MDLPRLLEGRAVLSKVQVIKQQCLSPSAIVDIVDLHARRDGGDRTAGVHVVQ